MSKEYVLNNVEDKELFRLKFQNEIWSDDTLLGIQSAGFSLGDSILDLGCGPGYLSMDLSKLVGPNGKIISVDSSKKFIDYFNREIENIEIDNIQTINCKVEELLLEHDSVEGAVARWLFMFLEDPEKVIKNVAKYLRKGGRFVIMEYFQFRSMSLWPPDENFTKIYNAVYTLLKSFGGNADIGGYMPEILSKNGFEIQQTIPVFKVGKPNTPLWEWLELTAKNHKNLVANNLITAAELDTYYEVWDQRSAVSSSFFTTPPLLITIGVKK